MKAKTREQPATVEALEPRRLLSTAAQLTDLLVDNFNGSQVNSNVWTLPTYASGGSYFGRTQQRVAENVPLASVKVSGGSAILEDDSYNPTDTNGNLSFYGTELISKQSFTISPTAGSGLDLKVRMKLNTNTGGIVAAPFFYNVISSTVHNEVDTELVSNQAAAGTNDIETNVYANAPFDAGVSVFSPLPDGGKLGGWHTYEEQVYADHVTWLVDGVQIRTENTILPTGPLQVYINIWTPDDTWPAAYNANIQAVASPSQNQKFTASVDSVVVARITPAADTTPPTPNPSTWAVRPEATSNSSITMTATTATDPSGVQYFFHNLTATGHDSGWQSSPTFTDTGLNANTKYSYEVRTRDLSPAMNTGKYSQVASATTPAISVTDVTINLSTSSVGQNGPISGSGSIGGSGSGTLSYYWAVEKPNTSVMEKVGKDIAVKMSDGAAAIADFIGLPTAIVGTYNAEVVIDSGVNKGLTSAAAGYTVTPPPPGISITKVPGYGDAGNAQGRVVGVDPSQYGVVVYININIGNAYADGWWGPKPYWDTPISPINADGTWSVNIDTGGVDADADEIVVYLVPLSASVPSLGAASSLPDSLSSYPSAEVTRTP